MFDVGFLEILLIGIVSLVVIGPERLPDVARTVGTWINKAQRFVRGVKSDLASELKSGDLKDLLGDQRKQINELRQMVQSTKRELEQSTAEAVKGAKKSFQELEESAADAGIVKPRHGVNRTLPSSPANASDQGSEPAGDGANVEGSDSSTVPTSEQPLAADALTGTHKNSSRLDASATRPGTTSDAGADDAAATKALPSDAVSKPVNSGPKAGSWASGIAAPADRSASTSGTDGERDTPAGGTGN